MNGTLFAIQLTDDDLKILSIRRENHTPLASPLIHVRLTDPEKAEESVDPEEVLSTFMEEIREHRPQALLVLNSRDLDYREFSYPFEAERKVRHAIDFELSTDFPFDKYVHDHVKAVGREPGYHAYIAGLVARSLLKARIQTLEQAGFRVVGITSDVSTLGEAFRNEDEALVMDTGERHTLFALYRLGVPVLLRKIPIGMLDLDGATEGHTNGLTRLGAEIKRTIHSFNARVGLGMKRLYVTGNLLLNEDHLSALQRQIHTEIVVRSLSDYDTTLQQAPESENANMFAPLIGAAFWKRKNGFFNFLKEEFVGEEQATLSSQRTLRWGAGFVAAFLLLLALSYSLDLLALRERQEFLKSETRSTFTSAFPQVTRVVDEVKQAKNLLDAEQSALAGGNPQGNAALITALRSISATIPENVPFQIASLFWESGKIEIYARTDSFKTVNTIQELLAGSTEIAQAAISNARHREEGQDVEFKLSIRFTG